ncbi:MAG: class I SAM-dependent methyltransferase [Lautropia sp.]
MNLSPQMPHQVPLQLQPRTPAEPLPACAVCGTADYVDQAVLWPELVTAWGLGPEETAYIDRQQGTICRGCGCNLRSIALARALCVRFAHDGALDPLLAAPPAGPLLEVNEAGTLHSRLRRFPGHRFGAYPECDLQRLPFADASFDTVVHSDTLEHVPDPAQALSETRRVLRPDGALVFTVPVVIGRLTRSRTGLPPSYHGAPGTAADDLLVHHEFGADVWTMVLAAGFARCELVPFGYPSGLALLARR